MAFTDRISLLRKQMEKWDVAAFFTSPDANWQYLAGLSRLGGGPTKTRQHGIDFACLVVTQTNVTAFIPELNLLGRKALLPDTRLIALPEGDINGDTFRRELQSMGISGKRVGCTRDVSSGVILASESCLSVSFVDMDEVLVNMRAVKDDEELQVIRKGVELTDAIYRTITQDIIHAGMSRRQLERDIDRLMEELGASGCSFPTDVNVQCQFSSSLGDSYVRLEKGSVVAFDFGLVYQNYCTDFGRTIFIGEPSKRLQDMFGLVYQAHMAGCSCLKHGNSCGEDADEAARAIFREAGLDKAFIHKLGHSIGLDVHERPFLARGEKEPFRKNEIYAVEPSLYLPQEAFLRVEDEVLVTDGQFEILSKIPHEPIVIE